MKKYILMMMLFLNAIPLLASADMPKFNSQWTLPSGKVFAEYLTETGEAIWIEVFGAIITPAHASKKTLTDIIKDYITAISDINGIDENYMLRLAQCESGYDPEILGDKGKSLGLYQWQVRSWAHYNNIFKTNLERESWMDQTKMTANVIKMENGWENWYNCTNFIRYGTWDKSMWHE